jgi:hypothetical protein
VGVARLLATPEVATLARSLGALLITAGGMVFAIALWRYRHGYKELRKLMKEILPLPIVAVLVVLLLAGTAMSLFLIFAP